MSLRSIRYRLSESNNIWPGFVDVLATLLIVIIFVLMVFTVSQIYLSDAISGRDRALLDLRKQINELSKILLLESKEKQQVIGTLESTEDSLIQKELDLSNQEALSRNLQADIAEQKSELFIQDQNILALGEQIKELLLELRIVAKALEAYEGVEILSLETDGLGERINKALATRVEQLNQLNNDLDKLNKDLEMSEINLQNKINNLMSINESLGLGDADLIDQLAAIQKKNDLLKTSQIEIQKAMESLDIVNSQLMLKDEALENKISEYQLITNELLAINDSLGLEDATLLEKLEAIRKKNSKLAELNLNLIKKDDTIFDLRGKILELNNILTLTEEVEISQSQKIIDLNKDLELIENEKFQQSESALKSITDMEKKSSETLNQISFLSSEIEILKQEINMLNFALESSEQDILTKELKIDVLGKRLNKALTSKIFELQKYRSEFFGKIKDILGNRDDIKIVGDRFIFESELLFDSGSANLQTIGMEKLKQIGLTLKETTNQIPDDIDWIIQVEGHTDTRPIQTQQFPSNWELSTARANSVLKLLLELGFLPNRLSAIGYGEFYPIDKDETPEAFKKNRRIELKLTSR